MQCDFKRQWYRVVAHRLVDHKRNVVIADDGVIGYWMPMRDRRGMFKLLVIEVERWWLKRGGGKGSG
jgi:hypothetical protein